jgi:iron complex outermembrane recepter protein
MAVAQPKTTVMTTRHFALLLLSSLAVCAAAARADHQSMTDLDLATLMNMDVTVTSAARRAQASSDAAAAVYVITREDIRRSGATSIPELLRGAPGIQVARETNDRWAVTARGFNSRFANKLLVLIDGRTVYTQQFSGVFWEQQHVPLDEIERIEIVRGPGGALWGANAVNGIINIITRSAADGAGMRIAAGAGDEDHGAASLHFGRDVGESGAYHAYAEQFQRDSFEAGGSPWRRQQAGWRFDSKRDGSGFTLQGDVARNDLGSIEIPGAPTAPVEDVGANLNLSWNGGGFDVQSSYSWRKRDKFALQAEQESALDLNLQYTAERMGRHLWTLGGGWRWLQDKLLGPEDFLQFTPQSTDRTQSSLYAQDEIFFFSDAVRVTAGAKVEDFEYTGISVQPTLRALWHIDSKHTVWSAYSRSVRTPSRFERGAQLDLVTIPGHLPVTIALQGNPDLQEEHLESRELGWRWRPSHDWSLDLALFDNRYDDLAVGVEQPPQFIPGPAPSILILQRFANVGAARSRGAEASVDWIVRPWLRLQANGTWFHMHAPDVTIAGGELEGLDPEQSYVLRTRIDLPHHAELDLSWRDVGILSSAGAKSYDSAALRFGWRPTEHIELSLSADNLFDHEHIEFVNEEQGLMPGDVVGRSFFLRAIWHSGRPRME